VSNGASCGYAFVLGVPLFLSTAKLLTVAFVLVSSSWGFASTITVDLAAEEGVIYHRANGYLVSIAPTQPGQDLIVPLKPTSFRGSVRHVLQNYDRLKEAGVHEFQLTVGYTFHDLGMQAFDVNRIGQDGDYTPWLAHVDHLIDQVRARHISVDWDIYNEPDLATLPIAENKALLEGWRLAYKRIKDRIPEAIVVGPSVSRYRLLAPFLEWCQAHDVFPDVVSYHEYGDPSEAVGYVNDLHAYLKTRGLARPISVNEIMGQESWTSAGYTAGVIAAYEKADILSAMRACWPDPQDSSSSYIENTCDNPTLDGLLYVDGQSKRPGWHVYKTYADLQGTRINTTTDSPRIHALAALDKASGALRVLMGKHADYSMENTQLVLKHLNRMRAQEERDVLHICAEQIPDVGSAYLGSTVQTLDSDLPHDEDDLSLTLPLFNHSDAYRVTLSFLRQC